MLTQQGFQALGEIYDASVNFRRWNQALDKVVDALEAHAIALVIRHPQGEGTDQTILSAVYRELKKSPWGVYYAMRYKHLQKPDWEYLSQQPAQTPTPDTALGIPTRELDRRGDYAFLRKRYDVGRRLGVRLNDDRAWFDAMSIGFHAGAERIPGTAVERAMPLLPHLTKAVEISRVFTELRARYRAVLSVLDRVQVGMMIALPTGDIIVENVEASRILDQGDGLIMDRGGRLNAVNADETAMLRQFIQDAANTANGEEDQAERLVTVTRPSARTPYLIDVAPLKDSAAELEGPLTGALITLIDPDRVPYLRMGRFAAIYGLSPAETEVCSLLSEGCSVNEIAERRNTTPVTAKNQCNAILAKAGVKRRVDLIRLIIRVLPPIE